MKWFIDAKPHKKDDNIFQQYNILAIALSSLRISPTFMILMAIMSLFYAAAFIF
jgi:hypothetical protein